MEEEYKSLLQNFEVLKNQKPKEIIKEVVKTVSNGNDLAMKRDLEKAQDEIEDLKYERDTAELKVKEKDQEIIKVLDIKAKQDDIVIDLKR